MIVFRAVVIAELWYASNAWWGFSATGDIVTTKSRFHPPPRLLHNGPCWYHEHHRYSWSHPVPPNSYQPKSYLTPSPPWKR